jgi:hypothetical protein
VIVGFDFAFSLPAWFLQQWQLTPRQLWALLGEEALTPTMRRLGLARWMNGPELPFWTTSQAYARLKLAAGTEGSRQPPGHRGMHQRAGKVVLACTRSRAWLERQAEAAQDLTR